MCGWKLPKRSPPITVRIKLDESAHSDGKRRRESFAGFQYIVNRSPDGSGKTSVEKSRGGFSWESAGSAQYAVSENVVLYSIPLASLGLTAQNCYIRIKACDNVTTPDDIMDYYVSGDSAPSADSPILTDIER